MALVPDTGFRVRFPEFDNIPDARVQAFLDDAVFELRKDAWPGALWPRAVNLYAAHMLSLAQKTAAGATGAVGPVASRSVDGVSISFAVAAGAGGGGDDWLRGTIYGQEMVRLMRLAGMTLLAV